MRRGFSLLEVVVVAAIFAVVSVAIISTTLAGQRTASRQAILVNLQKEAHDIVTAIKDDVRYALTGTGFDIQYCTITDGSYYSNSTRTTINSSWASWTSTATKTSIRFQKSTGYTSGSGQTYTEWFSYRTVKGESNVTDGADNNNNAVVDDCILERSFVTANDLASTTVLYRYLAGSIGVGTRASTSSQTSNVATAFDATARGKIPNGTSTGATGGFRIEAKEVLNSKPRLFWIYVKLQAPDRQVAWKSADKTKYLLSAEAETYAYVRD